MEESCKLVIIQYSSTEEQMVLMDNLFTNLSYYKKYGIMLSDKTLRKSLKKYYLDEYISEYKEDTLDYIVFDDCMPEIFRSKKIKSLITEGIEINEDRIYPVLIFSTVFPLKTFITPLGLIPSPKIFMPIKENYTSQDIDLLLRFMSVNVIDGVQKSINNYTNMTFKASRAREVADRYDELNRDVIPQIKDAAESGYYIVELTVKDRRVAEELIQMGYNVECNDCNNITVSW